MFTQAMPTLAQSLQGSLPQQAIRQLMQVLGNCNQPLEHRGPVAVTPGPLGREAGPGFYGSGAWGPDQLGELVNASSLFNNGAFIDSTVNNNHFGGDQFLFNNNTEFISNFFPTTFVIGQPGAAGSDGAAGAAGGTGRDGAPGAEGINGVDGAPGIIAVIQLDGRDGAAGPAGAPGQPGRDGDAGLVGPPGLPGRDGLAGGYRLQAKEKQITIQLTKVTVEDKTVSISLPAYKIDPESCDVVIDDEQAPVPYDITIPVAEVEEGVIPYNFQVPDTPALLAKPFYP